MKYKYLIILSAIIFSTFSCTDNENKAFIGGLNIDQANTDPSELGFSDTLVRDTKDTHNPDDDEFYLLIEVDKRDTCDSISFIPSQAPHEDDTMIVYIKRDGHSGKYLKSQVKLLVPVQIQGLDLSKNIVLKVVKPTKKRTGSTTYNNARNDKDNNLDKYKNLKTVCMFGCDYPVFLGCDDLVTNRANYWLELSQISTYTYQEIISQTGDIEITITEDPEGDRNGCCMIPLPSPNTDPTISLTVKPSNGKTRKGTAKYSNASTPFNFLCD